jgi:multiple sugar transport system permease protein
MFVAAAKHSRMDRTNRRWGMAFLVPMLLFMLVFMAYPVASVIRYSFTSWNGMGKIDFVGLANFRAIFGSGEFWQVFRNNVYFLLVGVPVWTLFPLVIAVVLFEEIKGSGFFKSAFFFPSIFSPVIVGLLFRNFFAYDGPINAVLRAVGLESLALEWLASGATSIPIIIIVINWAGFGAATLIYLAGMSTIEISIFESARLDGAGWWRRLTAIMLPMIRRVVQLQIVLNIIYAFTQLFSYVFVMTNGGPGYESTVVEYFIYIKAFRSNQLGYACAIALVLFVVVLVLSLFQQRLFAGRED